MLLNLASADNLINDFDHQEPSCPFCQQEQPAQERENTLTDNYEEDADLDGPAGDEHGVRFKNDSAALGAALEQAGDKQPIYYVDLPLRSGEGTTGPLLVTCAAHHLIPGNASLKESALFASGEYLRTDKMAAGNIGYDINKAVNGIWLPGNYAQRPWGTQGVGFDATKQTSSQVYAEAAAFQGGHFHDAHEDYSEFVKRGLNKLTEKLDNGHFRCPQAQVRSEDTKQKGSLRYIVKRLDAISLRMRRMLSKQDIAGMQSAWRWNIFTSSRMKNLFSKRFSKGAEDPS